MASDSGTTDGTEPKGGGTEAAAEESRVKNVHARESGLFLRMMLGPVNVRATQKDEYKVKEEYNAYRVRCFFLVF